MPNLHQNGVNKIKSWIGTKHWDIIQFNFGLWDVAYRPQGSMKLNKVKGVITNSPAVYKANLEKIVQELLKTKAKQIFVTTSYIRVNESGRISGDENIYNAIALEVMHNHGISVNNITTESQKIHAENGLSSNNVHYNEKGYEQLATLISEKLKTIL
jgi:lysophospholipase L1-like esterase